MKFSQLVEGFTDKALDQKKVLERIKKIMSRSKLCPKESILMNYVYGVASFDFEEEDPRGEHVLVHVRFTYENDEINIKISLTTWEGFKNVSLDIDKGLEYINSLDELDKVNSLEPLSVALINLKKTVDFLNKEKIKNNGDDFNKYFRMQLTEALDQKEFETLILDLTNAKGIEDEGNRWKLITNTPVRVLRWRTRYVFDVYGGLNIYEENGQIYIDKPKNRGSFN